jgi:hypothetical protein
MGAASGSASDGTAWDAVAGAACASSRAFYTVLRTYYFLPSTVCRTSCVVGGIRSVLRSEVTRATRRHPPAPRATWRGAGGAGR